MAIPETLADTSRPTRTAPRSLWACVLVLCALVILPLAVPLPPPGDAVEPQRLADPDGRFMDVEGVTVHYKQWGSADSTRTVLLLHGFGASVFSWESAAPLISEHGYRVVAIDRTGFGLTERPRPPLTGWPEGSPYSLAAQADQAFAVLERLEARHVTVVGHSQGAGTALLFAARYPEVTDGVVLAAPAVGEPPLGPVTSALLRAPHARRLGPLVVRRIAGPASDDLIRSAYAEPDNVTPEVIAGYRRPLRARDWDIGLWEQTVAPQPELPTDRTGALRTSGVPVLAMIPLGDRLVPPQDQMRTAADLDAQELHLRGAGHVYHEEHPGGFTDALIRFIEGAVYPDPEAPCTEG